MKTVIFLFFMGVVALSSAGAGSGLPQNSANPAVMLGDTYAAIVDHVKESVVSIRSEKMLKLEDQFPFNDPRYNRFFDPHKHQRQVPMHGLGSGFFIDREGHVLTNDHVVHGMQKIQVVLYDGKILSAKVIGSDSKTDLAVLALNSVPKNITPVRFGDSSTLKTGNIVLAIGAPFGLVQTVTSGIISATGRSDVGISDFEDFVQTDAPINPGNSGGPLLNTRGDVIAINSAIATNAGQSAGVGFAIPINMAKEILPTLLKGKKIARGMLGVGIQDITPAIRRQFHLSSDKGALVAQVGPGSPAEEAGIRAGDIIAKFAGVEIKNSHDFRSIVAKHMPKENDEIVLIRDGKERTLSAKLGSLRDDADDRGEDKAEETPVVAALSPLESFGIEAKPITSDLIQIFRLQRAEGLVILAIQDSSPAGVAGLQTGDIIVEVDRKKIDSVKDAEKIIAVEGKDAVLLLVDRGGATLYIALEKNPPED